MFRVFNAFQINVAFAAAPFGIGWLSTAQFPAAGAAFIASLLIYVVFFGFMTYSVATAIDPPRRR